MSADNKTKVVADDMVISLDYTLSVDGEVLDSSEDEGPIVFLQGHGNIIPGLEKELVGLAVGENKEVTVTPKDGYGEQDSEEIKDIPLSEFPEEIPLKDGIELKVKDDEGVEMYGKIVSVGEETVEMDFNHPLAGKTLQFSVKLIELRDATQEELAHGHVHSPGHAH
ncbi:MAG: peptidylprolyl isomerase [Chloroflexi bacterium]|nr:peptidylprolyl isomerase [Chloroflexota bacterium]